MSSRSLGRGDLGKAAKILGVDSDDLFAEVERSQSEQAVGNNKPPFTFTRRHLNQNLGRVIRRHSSSVERMSSVGRMTASPSPPTTNNKMLEKDNNDAKEDDEGECHDSGETTLPVFGHRGSLLSCGSGNSKEGKGEQRQAQHRGGRRSNLHLLRTIGFSFLLKKKKNSNNHTPSQEQRDRSGASGDSYMNSTSADAADAIWPESQKSKSPKPSQLERAGVSWGTEDESVESGVSRDVFKQRSITRRTRSTMNLKNNVVKNGLQNGCIGNGSSYVHQLRANTASTASHDTSMNIEDSLSSVILKTLSKKSLCDVELIGKDGVPVEAPSYLLAAHSEVFEAMFYSSESTTTEPKEEKTTQKNEGGDEASTNSDARSTTVELDFSERDAIEASMYFLATRSLPDGLEKEENEFNTRLICQIHLFGRLFKIQALSNQAYRTARRMMNKSPRLVCAAFDECIVSTKLLSPKFNLPSPHDELKEYALDYLRDSPLTTLLAKGTVYLSQASIEEVICDQNMDVDEHTMFHILNSWVKQDDDNIETGKSLVSNIHLSYIKTDYINSVVRSCGFVALSDVEAALKEIEELLATQSPDEKEHVLVESAGNDKINGIYVRMDSDIGLGGEEVMFVKEAHEDDYGPDYGMSDSSHPLHQPPKLGWKADGGSHPAPLCTWKPAREAKHKSYVAPNLADLGKKKKNICDMADGDHDEGMNRRMTLRTMLNLPTDEGHEDDDYHDDMDISETSRKIW